MSTDKESQNKMQQILQNTDISMTERELWNTLKVRDAHKIYITSQGEAEKRYSE